MSNEETDLCKIFFKNGADKCLRIRHSYSPAYHELFKAQRESVKSLLEIGIGTRAIMQSIVGSNYVPGASLRSWKEYFPNAEIFGLDIDDSIFFKDERISCFYADQSVETSLQAAMANIQNSIQDENYLFDIIIDDGSHIKEHMILSYNFLINFLKPGGLYIIEDIKRIDLNSFIEIENSNMEVCYIHRGINDWDDFIAFRRK